MKNFCENIILSRFLLSEGSEYRYRVIKTPCGKGNDYSLFVSTETGGECDECFVFSISTKEETAARICEYLAGETVSALHVKEILSDLLGEDSAPTALGAI